MNKDRPATKILAIEDSRSDQVLFRWAIERHKLPYSCTFATTLEQAKQALNESEFDVVICDFYLGSTTALDIFPLVRGTPMIIVTAAEDHDVAVGAMKAGAYDYLVKDFQGRYLQKLPLVIDNALRARHVTQEKLALEQQLYQKQKLEAVGVLAGGIAHDFNNILGSILGFSEIIAQDLQQWSGPEVTKENVQQVILAANRAKNLVEQILTFSRPGDNRRVSVRVEQVVEEVSRLVRATIPSRIELEIDVEAKDAIILADSTKMHQLLVNLCTNAAHAIGAKSGQVKLSLRFADQNDRHGLGEGMFLKLTVQDTGCGMSSEVKERIFEPFFTTKQVGEGTGMGLSIVHGIVRDHGGAIQVSSEEGKGTAFSIFFPCKREAAVIPAPVASNEDASQGRNKGTVLLVDDEQSLIEVGKLMLARMGYDVVASSSSTEALDLFRECPEKFDLVITDQTMPQLAGDELGKKLLALRADIPIIICTGYSEMLTPDIAMALGFKEQLSKPVSYDVLRDAVEKVIAGE